MISSWIPVFAFVGEPVSVPEFSSKMAHEGLFSMVKLSASFSMSLAEGLNEYSFNALM